jgi:hypothetical protein
MENNTHLIGLDLALASREIIEVLIEDVSEPGIFDEIARANTQRPDILNLLLENPDLPEDTKKFIRDFLHLPEPQRKDVVRTEKSTEVRAESLTQPGIRTRRLCSAFLRTEKSQNQRLR